MKTNIRITAVSSPPRFAGDRNPRTAKTTDKYERIGEREGEYWLVRVGGLRYKNKLMDVGELCYF